MHKTNPSSGTHQKRRTIRLKDYDYSQPGAYFITTVIHDRESILGRIQDEAVQLSPPGKIVRQTWLNLPHHFPEIQLDEFCIMPNHFHGIVVITAERRGGSFLSGKNPLPDRLTSSNHHWQTHETRPYPSRRTLPEIVGAFKSFSARRINVLKNTTGLPVWQRNYFEHIIRNDDDWNRIRGYILDNPRRWEEDDENPLTRKKDRWRFDAQEQE